MEESGSKYCSPVTWLPKLLRERELYSMHTKKFTRLFTEGTLRSIEPEASFIQRGHRHLLGACHDINVSYDGKLFYGYWTMKNALPVEVRHNQCFRFIWYFVEAEERDRKMMESGMRFKLKFVSNDCSRCLHLNLRSVCTEYLLGLPCGIHLGIDRPFDEFESYSENSRITIEPIMAAGTLNQRSSYNMPSSVLVEGISNMFAYNKSRVNIGLEMGRKLSVIDLATKQPQVNKTFKQSITSLGFSSCGNLIYVGLNGQNVISMDFRDREQTVLTSFDDARSITSIKALSFRPYSFITEDTCGEMRFWDIRNSKCLFKSDMYIPFAKSATYIDRSERFVMSCCLDGKTRAWSLLNGEKLCEFSSHQSRSVCSRPQIVYSPNWGGVPGNAAVLVATDGGFNFHHLII